MSLEIHRPEGIRLQKVLAAAGLGSRRHCESLIERGEVTVNGQRIDQVGIRVDPATAVIEVSGKRINVDLSQVIVVVNKPKGVVSTMSDPQGRPSLDQYVRNFEERLFHVGRLDAETTGVLLLTNHGELAHRLAHPSHGVSKIYLAQVQGRVSKSLPTVLKAGVELEDGPVRVTDCVVKSVQGEMSLVQVELHEGRNRIVRRMFEEVGHPVEELARIQFGPIRLGTLQPGEVRSLSPAEVGELMAAAGL